MRFPDIDYTEMRDAEHSLEDCFETEFKYMSALAKEKLTFQVPELGIEMVAEPVREVKISDLMFTRQYSCMDYGYCSRCCLMKFFKMFLSPSVSGAIEKQTFVNGQEITYYVDDTNWHGKCQFLTDNNLCQIHLSSPPHCCFPLVSFRKNKNYPGRTYIQKRQFGRNHLIGCPIDFHPYTDYSQFESDTLSRFYRLRDYYRILGINSHIDQVMAELKERGQEVIGNKYKKLSDKKLIRNDHSSLHLS